MEQRNTKREFVFKDDAIIPIFTINKQKSKPEHYNQQNIENILTNDFNIQYQQQKIPIQNYFKKDLYTGDYIKIMIMKNEGEHLELNSTPEIGFAYEHSGFSPIGNVSYNYEKEDNTIIEAIKKKNSNKLIKNVK